MLWIKAFHILAMTSWMAGIFYLPRIFVHYVEGQAAGQDVARLQIMAQKLYGFMTIMAVFTLGLGLWLWLGYGIGWGPGNGWMHAKLTVVLAVIAYHHMCARLLRQFEAGACQRSHVWFRWFNEIPVLLLLVAVVLVVVKPF